MTIETTAPVTDVSGDSSVSSETPQSEPAVPQTAPEPKRYKLKVDGEEMELPEDDVLKYAQIGKAKDKRFEEANRIMRDAQGRFTSMKDKWHEHLQEQGVDPYEAATKFLATKIRRDMMTPEERERADLQEKVSRYEQEKQQAEEQAQQQAMEAEKNRHLAQLDQELPVALAKAQLPKTPGAIRRVAQEMMRAMQNGYDISMEEAAQIVRDEYLADVRELVSRHDDPMSILPQSVAEKMMAAHLSKVKSAPSFAKSSDAPPAPAAKEERLSPEEYRKLFR